jgi:hypothetical protein
MTAHVTDAQAAPRVGYVGVGAMGLRKPTRVLHVPARALRLVLGNRCRRNEIEREDQVSVKNGIIRIDLQRAL